MASPNNRASNGDGGFNNIQKSRAEGRRRNETLQTYTFAAVGCMLVLTVALLVVMAVGGVVGGEGGSPLGQKVDWGSFTVTATDTLHGDLVLVDNDHAYSFPSTDDHLENIYSVWAQNPQPRPYILSGLSAYMDRDALIALDKMLAEFASKTGNSNVQLRHAYRTLEEQEGKDILPGHSDHHTGLGVALKYEKDGTAYDLALDSEYDWLYKNCHKYGFIVRYPDEKADVTGIEEYNYYFRYVGVAHATYMEKEDLCLEEYLEVLKEHDQDDPLAIRGADGKKYEVYYVAVDGSATVKYPTNYAYTVSGTNEGGVVVTVDRSAVQNPDSEQDTDEVTDEAEN